MSDLRAWAARAWPEHDWTRATLARGAFHDVLVLSPVLVARIPIGARGHRRAEREAAVLAAVAALGLPVQTPAPLGDPVEAEGRSGQCSTFVAGELREQASWCEVRDGFAEALDALGSDHRTEDLVAVPGPRQWCGGDEWTAIVADRLGPRLPIAVAHHASRVAAEVLATEEGVAPGFVHGDLGLHNVLWTGTRITGLVDLDNAAVGDPAIDVAPLLGRYGARRVGEIVAPDVLARAMRHRASLSLQVAAAAELAGRAELRDHALRNFCRRYEEGTLYDPGRSRPA